MSDADCTPGLEPRSVAASSLECDSVAEFTVTETHSDQTDTHSMTLFPGQRV